jgi:hypothetical protein
MPKAEPRKLATLVDHNTGPDDSYAYLLTAGGQLQPQHLPGLTGARRAQRRRRTRVGHDAFGNGASAEIRRTTSHQHSQHFIPALARLAESGEPMSRAGKQLSEYAPEPNPVSKKKDLV